MSIIWILSLVWVLLATDPCQDLFKLSPIDGQRYRLAQLNLEGREALSLSCLRNLLVLSDETAREVLEAVKNYTQIYSLIDDLKHMPRVMRNGGMNEDVDIMGRLDSISTTNVNAFEFYSRIEHTFALARDLHTNFIIPCYSSTISVLNPVSFCPYVENDKLLVKTCEQQPLSVQLLGISVPSNRRITSINGRDAVQFLENFAENHSLRGRDHSQRFDYFIAAQQNISPLMLLARNEATEIDFSRFAFTAFDLKFDDGTGVIVPLFLIGAGSGSTEDIASACTRDQRSATESFPDTRQVALELTKVNFPAAENTGLWDIKSGDSKVFGELEPFFQATESLRQRDFAYHANYPYYHSLNSSSYFGFYTDKQRCVLIVRTFSPQNHNIWFKELNQLMVMLKQGQCGLVTGTSNGHVEGRRLVLDFRSNGGGDPLLVDVFLSLMAPNYSPHHFSVVTRRLAGSSQLIEELESSHLFGTSPVREPYTHAAIPQCGGVGTYGCKGWAKGPITRQFGNETQNYSRPLVLGPFYWEAPVLKSVDEYNTWLERPDVKRRFGPKASVIASLRFMISALNYAPDPELTVYLFGQVSASATAMVATRVLSYHLGAVVRAAYPGHKPLMTALVPGGDFVSYGAASKRVSGLYSLPHNPFFTVSTRAFVAITHETARIGGATTPLEFVPLPPQYVLPIWQSIDEQQTVSAVKVILEGLEWVLPQGNCVKGMYSPHFTAGCSQVRFKHAKFVGRLCDEMTGEYSGECGVALCDFGYELLDGACIGSPHPPKAISLGMGFNYAILLVAICGVLLAISSALTLIFLNYHAHRKCYIEI